MAVLTKTVVVTNLDVKVLTQKQFHKVTILAPEGNLQSQDNVHLNLMTLIMMESNTKFKGYNF